jgi:fluoride ion exporter CrcB/FEX
MVDFWARTAAVAIGGALGAVGRFWITSEKAQVIRYRPAGD